METKVIMAGIGEILWDVFEEKELLGGAPVNFSFYVNELGGSGVPISTLGEDSRGGRAVKLLQQRGIETAGISAIGSRPTGFVSIRLDSSGVAHYSFPDEVAWDNLEISPYAAQIQQDVAAVCFGTLAQRDTKNRSLIYDLLDGLPKSCLRVFDVNFRQSFYSKEIIIQSMERADIVKFNEEELPQTAQLLGVSGDDKTIGRTLLKMYGLTLLILTRGSGGSLLLTPEASHDHPGYPTTLRDTIGAGDGFTAAAILGYHLGHDLKTISDHANRVASHICSQEGAMVRLPKEFVLLL